MRVLVVGGTSGVGAKCVEALLRDKHEVRVLARGEAEIEGVAVFRGDVRSSEAVLQALEGCQAVLDCHGCRPVRLSRPSDLWADPEQDETHPASVNYGGVKNLVEQCQKAGVKRLVRLTGLTCGMAPGSLVPKIFNFLCSQTVWWHQQSEALLRASGLDYTIVQPSGLRDEGSAKEMGKLLLVQTQADSFFPTIPPKSQISRADVAELFVRALQTPQTRKATLRCVSVADEAALPDIKEGRFFHASAYSAELLRDALPDPPPADEQRA